MTESALTAYQLHLPDEVRLFRYEQPPIAVTADALVFEGSCGDTAPVICRSYLFFTRWLEVFITFDPNFALRPDPYAVFPFAFNCDITTPYHRSGNRLYTTDLCLDLLVAADGRTYQVTDVEEFEQYYQRRIFGRTCYQSAQRELASLIDLLASGQFLDMLATIAPFPTKMPTAGLSTMQKGNRRSTGFIEHPKYPVHE